MVVSAGGWEGLEKELTEMKKEYKKLAMEIHPDKNPETEEQFKQLAAVYAILKDERTRAMYHRVSSY